MPDFELQNLIIRMSKDYPQYKGLLDKKQKRRTEQELDQMIDA